MRSSENVFSDIYKNRGWSNGSGSGSLPENTAAYRNFLQNFLKEKEIASVLDLGCGDWQTSRLVNWKGIDYLGVDVVGSVIEENIKKYQTRNIQFSRLDITHDLLPPADLVIIKDVLQHWTNEAIHSLRPRLSKYTYALITNTLQEMYDASVVQQKQLGPLNEDIAMGDARLLDLSLPPFSWPIVEVFRHISYRKLAKAQEVKTTVLLTT